MQRKIPLLPTWLFFGAFLGPIFVRKLLLDRGVPADNASSISILVAVLLLVAAGAVLYVMRDQLPPSRQKPKRRRWRPWRRNTDDASGSEETSDG